jgi:hypothetical protein
LLQRFLPIAKEWKVTGKSGTGKLWGRDTHFAFFVHWKSPPSCSFAIFHTFSTIRLTALDGPAVYVLQPAPHP